MSRHKTSYVIVISRNFMSRYVVCHNYRGIPTSYLVYFYTKVSTYLLIIHWCHTSSLSHSNTNLDWSKYKQAMYRYCGDELYFDMSGPICLCQVKIGITYVNTQGQSEGTQWWEAEQILLTALIEYLSVVLEYLDL